MFSSSHVSAFDEALSRPLVDSRSSTTSNSAPTPASSNTTSSTTISNGSSQVAQSSATTGSANMTDKAASLTSTIMAAFSSKKLPPQNTNTTTRAAAQPKPPMESFSNNMSTSTSNPFDDSYEPPNLEKEQQDEHIGLLKTQTELDQQQQMEEALLRERHTEALEITRDMRQINEISKDLANIVESQQTNIDEIEEDIIEIHDSAERGMSHLERASELMTHGSQNEAFWKVLFGVLSGGGLLSALVLLWSAFHSD